MGGPKSGADGPKPVMLIAGDDADSKGKVTQLNEDLGFETLDVGALSRALHLEHMTLLWRSKPLTETKSPLAGLR